MKKKRIDELLVERNLATSIDEARRFIMAGLAIADDTRIDKAGDKVSIDADIRLKNKIPYVSRGGFKLKGAVDSFKLDFKNTVCLDIGASTGGFTDVCLIHGAKLVYAVDSGFNQLHNKLLHDNRVKSFENSNFKFFEKSNVEEDIDVIVTDVSFISLKSIFPNATNFSHSGTKLIALIKPQFEAEKDEVETGGLVHDLNIHKRVAKTVIQSGISHKFTFIDLIPSPIKGTKGNIEYLSYFIYDLKLENYLNNENLSEEDEYVLNQIIKLYIPDYNKMSKDEAINYFNEISDSLNNKLNEITENYIDNQVMKNQG